MLDVDELFHHSLSCLPEAVGDLLRTERDPNEFILASFDGSSELGIALIASELATERGDHAPAARADVARMVAAASHRGEELVVSLMVTKDVLARMLAVANVDAMTRIAVRMWLDAPLDAGQYRVVAVAGEQVRVAAVDGEPDGDADEPPSSSSSLN